MRVNKRPASPAGGLPVPRVMTPAGYSAFVRRKVAVRLEQVCDALLDKAAKGDLAAVKVLMQMAALDKSSEKEDVEAPLAKQAAFVRKTLAEYRAGRGT